MRSTLSLLFIINAIVSIILIVLERKNPEKTIAWLLIFIVLPPCGLILYIFLGRNWKKHKLHNETNINIEELIYEASKDIKDNSYSSLIELLSKNSESPLFTNNTIKIFKDGSEKFKSLKNELLKAKNHIHLEYYIVKSDTIGNEIKDILIKKSLEGVKVRFILDRVGCIRIKKKYIQDLKDAGIDVVQYSYFLAPILRHINTQINYRNHRKIVVIDGKIGFVGGINIGDEYVGKSKYGYWRDTHIMVNGDFVLGLQAVFLDDFATIKEANKELFYYDDNFEEFFPSTENNNKKLMQLIKSGPDSEFPAIEQAVLKMISLAKDHIYITTPYFIPSESILNALKIASLSGVDVHILFPGKYDHILVHYASRTYLEDLVKNGIRLYFYDQHNFVHAKTTSIDGKMCTIGTANMDIRSYELNYEINAVIYDEETTEELETLFFEDLKKSKRITLDYFNNLSPYTKAFEAFCRIFSSLM
ncbi:cardiolipin synthase [Clostridium carboxidivorans P7]|uniref:Cardiolipin synthase n=1 Tax=Clostridium carboxidivorans P7 TaxID=536227 RepID=C6Q210_9CLOT|nr:cardiolipin synthase [Clostridium carboxidivorans]AKN32126.1 cardiolipin synthase [Clostridium carboxidivorans P7]EET84471.1 phospholipase D/Transphosphatidylase [Clostridium carboxidivorans P7]